MIGQIVAKNHKNKKYKYIDGNGGGGGVGLGGVCLVRELHFEYSDCLSVLLEYWIKTTQKAIPYIYFFYLNYEQREKKKEKEEEGIYVWRGSNLLFNYCLDHFVPLYNF